MRKKHLPWLMVLVLVVAGTFTAFKCYQRGTQPDAGRIAAAETQMWKAYYTLDLGGIHGELIKLLQAQFGISLDDADPVARNLATAAMKFETGGANNETEIKADLVRAYRRIAVVTKRNFDPQKAAQAELAWWVARRTPGRNSPEEVGKLIGSLYSVLYGSEKPEFAKAGILRAQAAHLRDQGGMNCDWSAVERLLKSSYQTLLQASSK
jgi:hypothetical protein